MKKFLVFAVTIALLIGSAGCTNQISDAELLEKTFNNMENMVSSKVSLTFSVGMLGFTTGAASFEILTSQEKSYVCISFNSEEMPLFDLAGIDTIEVLVEGDNVQIRSNLIKGLEEEFTEEIADSLKNQATDPLEFMDIILSDKDFQSFNPTDNPEEFNDNKYKSYRKTFDQETTGKLFDEESKILLFKNLGLEDEDTDFDELKDDVEKVFKEMNFTMETFFVVDTETHFIRHLILTVTFDFPIPAEGETEWMPETVKVNMEFVIDYLEINTKLIFPEFN